MFFIMLHVHLADVDKAEANSDTISLSGNTTRKYYCWATDLLCLNKPLTT
jgi:hypothetical protein